MQKLALQPAVMSGSRSKNLITTENGQTLGEEKATDFLL